MQLTKKTFTASNITELNRLFNSFILNEMIKYTQIFQGEIVADSSQQILRVRTQNGISNVIILLNSNLFLGTQYKKLTLNELEINDGGQYRTAVTVEYYQSNTLFYLYRITGGRLDKPSVLIQSWVAKDSNPTLATEFIQNGTTGQCVSLLCGYVRNDWTTTTSHGLADNEIAYWKMRFGVFELNDIISFQDKNRNMTHMSTFIVNNQEYFIIEYLPDGMKTAIKI